MVTAPNASARRDSAVPGVRVRVPAQDRLPAAATRGRRWPTCGRASAADALFLYLHVPFCEMRCGFCNLFTRADAAGRAGRPPTCGTLARGRPGRCAVRSATAPRSRARAFGGGTPTYLTADELTRAVRHRHRRDGRRPAGRPAVGRDLAGDRDRRTGSRCSPRSGADRVSIGVQSFLDVGGARRRPAAAPRPRWRRRWPRSATARFPRAQHRPDLRPRRADRRDVAADPGPRRWPGSPEELYLYPLYVRPLTGLGDARTRRADWDAQRLAALPAGGARPLGSRPATEQVSMRLFRRADAATPDGPVYCCQDDGMVGLGCGARSYTPRCTTPSTTRSASRRYARSSTTTSPDPPRISRTPSSGSGSTARSSAGAGC